MSVPAPLDKGRISGRCGDCAYVWVVAYLPMPVDRAATLARLARCPRGCEGKVFCA